MTEIFKKEDMSKASVTSRDWRRYKRRGSIRALRIQGPFEIRDDETLISTCDDGYLVEAIEDNPYPVSKNAFETIYEIE